ncbi:low affinity iron permease family protein [Brevundimonas sp.]|uniref:low affinity iron permease family protein n=1 Tax=Brevundimonas sp. TaxID=1871086 RepID=UPI003F70E2AD
MEKQFVKFATATAKVAGKPWTFIGCLAIVLVWAATGPIFKFSEAWQLVINTGTTIITFLMVFLIQNTQNRDGAAMQAKLDELLHAVSAADERFIGIEHLTEKDLAKILAEVEARAQRLHGDDQMPVVATRAEDLSVAAGSAAGKPAAKKAPRRRKASA